MRSDREKLLDTINGALQLADVPDIHQNRAAVTVSGDWTNNGGTLTPGGHAVIFNGDSNQSLGGTMATGFHDLVINDGLVGYWKLDDGSGTTAL